MVYFLLKQAKRFIIAMMTIGAYQIGAANFALVASYQDLFNYSIIAPISQCITLANFSPNFTASNFCQAIDKSVASFWL